MNLDHDLPYFNMSVDRCRITGRRGGRASASNRRLRKLAASPAVPVAENREETAAEAIARLDAQFPWLRGAKHSNRRRPAA